MQGAKHARIARLRLRSCVFTFREHAEYLNRCIVDSSARFTA